MAVDFNRCHRLDKIPQALKKLKNGIKSGVVSIVTNGHNATNLYDQKNQLSYQAKNQQAIVATLDSDWEAADEVLSRGNIEREYQTQAIEAKSRPWDLMTKQPVDICHLCGKDLYAATNYETVWISDRESSDSHCLYPNGISSYSVEINILSNNLLILGHPFNHFPKLGIFDPQLVSEQIACAQAYAEQNIFFGYIGNITPNIYKSTEPNQFLVGNLKNKPKKFSKKNEFFLSYTEKLGSILTDREWLAACDLEYYLQLANLEINQLNETLNVNFTILPVQPGQWEITCFSHLHSRNENYKHYPLMIFKHCGEIKEKCASLSTFAVDSKYRSPEDEIQIRRLAYPDLYPTRLHVLDKMFSSVGAGFVWINGMLTCQDRQYRQALARFIRGEREPEIETPTSQLQKSSGLSKNCALENLPANVHPEYLNLALEYLQFVLTHPTFEIRSAEATFARAKAYQGEIISRLDKI